MCAAFKFTNDNKLTERFHSRVRASFVWVLFAALYAWLHTICERRKLLVPISASVIFSLVSITTVLTPPAMVGYLDKCVLKRNHLRMSSITV